jgi:hypothetical protein
MVAKPPSQSRPDNRKLIAGSILTSRFSPLVRNLTDLPPRMQHPLPREPAFNAATDLHPGLLEARPTLYMLGAHFRYSALELAHVASKVGASAPVKLLSETGLEKFRELVRLFREQGLVVSEKNPDRDAARGCTYHSRYLCDFMKAPSLLGYFSRIAGIELIPIPIRYSQVQINMLPAYNPKAREPGFGTHIDSTNFACVLMLTDTRRMEGGALQHALMTREQFFVRAGSDDNVANAHLHMVLADDELLTTSFPEAGTTALQQGVLVPHQVENVRKVDGTRDTVAFTLHPANPMVRRLDYFSAASTWNSRGIKEDIGNLLVELADRRIEAINGALALAQNLADTTDAIGAEQFDELRTGLQHSQQLKRAAEQFLVDLANGMDGISCPDDTFVTPSVFDISYKG